MSKPKPWYINEYDCDCGNSWTGEWSCCCDEECGKCGKDVSPTDSEWVGDGREEDYDWTTDEGNPERERHAF